MFIYKQYMTESDIEEDIKNNKLKNDTKFIYNNHLYVVSHGDYNLIRDIYFETKYEFNRIAKQYCLEFENDTIIRIGHGFRDEG